MRGLHKLTVYINVIVSKLPLRKLRKYQVRKNKTWSCKKLIEMYITVKMLKVFKTNL